MENFFTKSSWLHQVLTIEFSVILLLPFFFTLFILLNLHRMVVVSCNTWCCVITQEKKMSCFYWIFLPIFFFYVFFYSIKSVISYRRNTTFLTIYPIHFPQIYISTVNFRSVSKPKMDWIFTQQALTMHYIKFVVWLFIVKNVEFDKWWLLLKWQTIFFFFFHI